MKTTKASIAFIFALPFEVPQTLRNRTRWPLIRGKTIRVTVAGMGKKKARSAACELIEAFPASRPDCLFVLGFCGGARDDIPIGRLIIPDVLAYEQRLIGIRNDYINKIKACLGDSEYRTGTLQTFDCPVLSRSGINEHVVAVDMESFAIAEVCRQQAIQVVVAKAVTDIVPRRASLRNLLMLLPAIRSNIVAARNQLDHFVRSALVCCG